MKYIKSLDGLRAFAVTLVVIFHFGFLDFGWVGVQLFFILSGYLITNILLSQKQEKVNIYLKRFYLRRALRIFPLYFGYLLLLTAIFAFLKIPELFDEYNFYLFSYTYNFTRLFSDWRPSESFMHLWSLSTEWQFYIVWPLVIYFLPRKSLEKITILIVIISPIIRLALGAILESMEYKTSFHVGSAIYWFPLSHLDAFAVGAAIPIFQLGVKVKKPFRLFIIFSIFLLALGIMNLAYSRFYWMLDAPNTIYYLTTLEGLKDLSSLGFPLAEMRNYQHVWSYTAINFCSASLIIYLVSSTGSESKAVRNLLSRDPLVNIGKVSYGIYVIHLPIEGVLKKFIEYDAYTFKGLIIFVFYFACLVAIANLSYKFYETPFLKLKRE